VISVSAGNYHSLALKCDGTVVAWGGNDDGECDVPEGLNNVVAISAGGMHNLALKADGTVMTWGWNGEGQCDLPSNLTGVSAIAAGWQHSLAVQSDGEVVAWGGRAPWDPNGMLQDPPEGLNDVVAIAASNSNVALFDTVNHPPVAATYNLITTRGVSKTLTRFQLHQICSDPDWDTFIITAVSPSSAAGGRAQINGNTISYVPPLDFIGADSFTYTVRDCRGASSEGTVNITVQDGGPVVGDLNNDGCVDRRDLTVLMSKIQARSRDLTYDLNGDGKVDVADARFLVLHFTNPDGSPCPP
jgi:hypothetical protein